jgi:hypothetical protein
MQFKGCVFFATTILTTIGYGRYTIHTLISYTLSYTISYTLSYTISCTLCLGYDSFAPTTDGAKVLLSLLSIPGITIFGVALGQMASLTVAGI